ncbi:MAG TPA: VCBS repeat-containing protein, partial [Candidatus Polarisedimenticolaceae bacterium]
MKSIRWGFVLLAPLLLVPPTRAQGLALEWSWTTAGSGDPFPNHVHVVSTPLVMDMNADGTPDVVFTATDSSSGAMILPGVVRVVSGDDGRELVVPGVLVNATCTVALGDIDGDGRPEIVTVDESGGKLLVLEHDGTLKWKATWFLSDVCAAGAPSLADLDGDGTPEIVMGRQAVRNDGTLMWTGTGTSGKPILGPHSVVVDLDLDGDLEVLAGPTAYTAGGGVLWTNPAPDGYTAVANLDGDSFPEVVLVEGGRVRLLDGESGTTRWGPVSIPGGGLGGPPTLADVEGDGTPEIAVSASYQLAVFESDGQLKWNAAISDASSQRAGIAAFDLDANGAAEIVHRDEYFLRVFRGNDGAVLRQTALSSCTWTEYPTVADVDVDGSAEILVGANSNCGLGTDHGVFAFESAGDPWGPARPLWNEYGYHVTNVNDDGTVPAVEKRHWLFLNGFR